MLKFALLSGCVASLVTSAHADITWTGAVSNDVFDEANWDLSTSTVTAIDPNVSIDDNVVFANFTTPAEIPNLAGQQRFQIGDGFMIKIDNAAVMGLANDGIGCSPGPVNGVDFRVINGGTFNMFFIVNDVRLDLDGTADVTFGGGGNPINLSTVNMATGSVVRFLLEDVTEFTNEHLSKFTANQMPAVIGSNLDVVSDGATGCIVTVITPMIGTNYCMANNNSTGGPSGLSADGSATVADNDLTLTASDLPNNSFGFFITSRTQGFVANPNGSAGNLCVLGAIGRYVGPGQIQTSGSVGEFSLTLDLTQTPTPTGLVAVMATETWNFQAWHRDSSPSGPTSNFTDGLSILFL